MKRGLFLLIVLAAFALVASEITPVDIGKTIVRNGRKFNTYYYDLYGRKNYLFQLYDKAVVPKGVNVAALRDVSVAGISLESIVTHPIRNLPEINVIKLPVDVADRISWIKLRHDLAVKGIGLWPVVTYHAKDPLWLDGQLNIQFGKYTTKEQQQELLDRFGLEIVEIDSRDDNNVRVRLPLDSDPFEVADALYLTGLTRWVQPRWMQMYETKGAVTPNDPYFHNQWHLDQINAPDAWDIETGGASVKIAIVDSGVETSHPDLNVTTGYDFLDRDNDPNPDIYHDDHEGVPHGTSCSGLAAAKTNNGKGVSGVCWGCTVIPVRVIGGAVYPDTIKQALEYAVDQGAWVVNNSWGPQGKDNYGNCISAPFDNNQAQAVDYGRSNGRGGKGAIMLWAAGNDHCNTSYQPNLGDDDIIVVSALDSSGGMANYSNYGNAIDVAAGAGAYTTDLTGQYGYNYGSYDYDSLSDLDYTSVFSGTSAATPVTSGAVAVMLAANPDMTFSGALNCIKASAYKTSARCSEGSWVSQSDPYLESGSKDHSPCYGFGVVDLFAMVNGAKNGSCGACVPRAPIDLCYGSGTDRDDDCNGTVDDDCENGGKGRAADPCTADDQCQNVALNNVKCEKSSGWKDGYCTATCTKNTDCYNGASGVECYEGRCIAHCNFNKVRDGYACLVNKILPKGTEVQPVCGNKIVEDGEKCDKGFKQCSQLGDFSSGWAVCKDDCSGWDLSNCKGGSGGSFCGNGDVEDGETCDGNAKSCKELTPDKPVGEAYCKDDCSGWDTSSCKKDGGGSSTCGNGIRESGEECDDGNTKSGDGCSSTCQKEGGSGSGTCGNGIKEAGEECDDGNTKSGDGCSSTCQKEGTSSTGTCGNGIRESGEECDDGNTVPFDGCDQFCHKENGASSDDGGCSILTVF